MGAMNGDCGTLLRRVLGEPTVSSALWDTVTSVGEGDEDAYADALVAIGRSYGRYCVEAAVRDQRAPGVVLDTLIDRFSADDHLPLLIAGHPNVTANVEQYCRRKRRVKLNEFLAGSHGVSDEAVERLLKSRVHRVIGALLGNSSLSEDVLRRAELRAHSIGMRMGEIVWDGRRNASMPEDVVLSWLNGGDERAHAEALSSPLCPRGELWRYLTGECAHTRSEGLDSRVFSGWSNADGQMVDYYASGVVAGIVRGDTDFDHEHTLRLALRHPRVWSSTVEKAYTMVDHTLRLLASVMGSPACPEWVWADALARSGRLLALSDNYVFVKTERVFDAAWLSGRHARRLLDAGLAYYAVFVACASQGTLTRVADFALARSPAWKWLLRDVAAHRNTPPEARRELVRWFPESLWLVARDGFLGRARLQK